MVFQIVGVIMLGFICIFIINVLYKRTNYYKNGRLQFNDLLNRERCSLRIVNIGSTYSQYAFGTLK